MKVRKLIAFVSLLCGAILSVQAAQDVVINEFMASNGSTLTDEDLEFSDWIELYNTTAAPINLQNWALTDDPLQPGKWKFPSYILPANGYLVVFASGKNRVSPKFHTNFSLNADGEYLALVRPDGSFASKFAPQFPQQHRDVSYGYDAARTGYFYFTTATPGLANSGGVIGFVADTKFSAGRGFYTNAFDLTISTATSGATIRYTLDGTVPTATTGLIYSTPLRIAATTVLRAAAFKTGYRPSNTDTETYIFLDDVIRQSPTGAAPPGWPTSWGGNTVDYGMDPDVVNNSLYASRIKSDLQTIPSFSIVVKLADLFDSSTGIYANPGQDGRAWERPCSVELIYPDGTKGFQIDAGLRIRGGFSRSTSNPKHAFRWFFREEFGKAKLKYPLFPDNGTDQFDAIDLRTFQNYSWSFQGDANGVFLRDQWSRDTQLAMGWNAERGNFYHLYVNGQYWGLYNTCERTEASYAETYFGGSKDDYDVIKVEAGPYTINATDGTMDAWSALYNLCLQGINSDAAYQRLLGNNPDGTPNPNYPVYIDPDNLIDYMLVIYYTGNIDAPISNFLGNTSPNNWYGIRNRNPAVRKGFQFFAHDSEHTLLPWNVSIDRTGPFPAGDTSITKSSPQWVFQKMWGSPEFRLRVADRVQKYFFNNGLLTPGPATARFMARKDEIDRAVVGESARWGDAKRTTPLTRNVDWVNAINAVVNNFFPQRTAIVVNQLKAKNLYPTVVAPTFSQFGGNVTAGARISITAPAGVIFYTLNGSDPRTPGGGISGTALTYSSPITLNESLTLKARVLNGTNWSALVEAPFTIIRTFKELVITELMYHPPATNNIDGDDYEFIELKNIGTTDLDLSGIHFTQGVTYAFPNGSSLAPGKFAVLVKNPTAFQAKYPNVPIAGVYTNSFANGGEQVALVHAAGAEIFNFTYSDAAPWPISADGGGFSLVPIRAEVGLDLNDPANWRASSNIGGSPGADDVPANLPKVLVTEVLTHTDLPQIDSIELFNPENAEANISGWYLSDDLNTPKKFRIPYQTILQAGAYKVYNEDDFNPEPVTTNNFRLNSHGDQIYLFSADAAGNLTGYIEGFAYGPAANGVSFGRYVNSVGEILYPAQKSLTFGETNSGPRVGPIVINEINYHPLQGDPEFVELKNISSQAVKFYDPNFPTNHWRIEGIDFTFPANFELPGGGLVVVTAADPAQFRSKYGVPANTPVLGPFNGVLQDNGEMVRVLRPDGPDLNPDGTYFIPYITMDEVRYDDDAPWPNLAAGGGSSLEKIKSDSFGNDPIAWRASPGQPSPGYENDGNRPPIVNAGADQTLVSATFPLTVNISGSATDDGQPNGKINYQWSQASGPGVVTFLNGNQAAAQAQLPGVGVYVLRLTANDGELQSSGTLTVTVTRPLDNVTLVPKGSTWRYMDDGSNQGIAWKESNFNDGTWKSGKAQLGYGDGDEVTLVNSGGSVKFITTYFRSSFVLLNASSVTSLMVNLLRDDGGVVYINGVEVFRSNMPLGTITSATLASAVVSGADETSNFFSQAVDPAVLRNGTNVIAVEIHQQNTSSSDISFDLELTATTSSSNKAPTASAGLDLTVNLPDTAILNGVVTDDGLPNPPGVFSATWSQTSGPGVVTFANPNAPQTSAAFSQPGVYILHLSVTDGQLSAQDDVTVTVTGTTAYDAWKQSYFTSAELNDPAISGDNADPDGDGVSNLSEFIAGTDPRDQSSYFHVSLISRQTDDAVLKFDVVAQKSYSVLARDGLEGTSAWENVLDLSPQAASATLEIVDPITPDKTKRFYQIVTPQLHKPE